MVDLICTGRPMIASCFLSYQDGWPHLYSMNAQGGSPLLLTPGHFMCEHIALSADKNI
ncbi:MAG: hypothetical protein IPI77_08435 [Saprospiraceae bacterium]|nr:hypothetical protein [Saprospiraceae bacterium]